MDSFHALPGLQKCSVPMHSGVVKDGVLVGECDGIRRQVVGALDIPGGAPFVFFDTIALPAY